MTALFAELQQMWSLGDPVTIAAFALWRINWVHPYKNGNGRTARAFAYACMCLKFGLMLPGVPTVIDLINENRDEYLLALADADEKLASAGLADTSVMKAFVERLLVIQLSSVPEPGI